MKRFYAAEAGKREKDEIRRSFFRLNRITATISDQDGVGYGLILDPEKFEKEI